MNLQLLHISNEKYGFKGTDKDRLEENVFDQYFGEVLYFRISLFLHQQFV